MDISVVVVADTRASAVDASLDALVPAVAHAEAAGSRLEVVVVDSSNRPDVAAFLTALEGATVVAAPGADRAQALRLGLAEAQGDVVWFAGTDTCAVPAAITTMVEAVRRDGGIAVAAPEDPAPHAAAPAAVLRRLWASPPVGDPVPALVRAAADAGTAVSRVSGAGTLRGIVRNVVKRGVTAGPGTYTGTRTSIEPYFPQNRVELGAYCSIADDVRLLVPGGRLFDEKGEEFDMVLRGVHRPETATTFPIGILVPDEPFDEPPPGATGERLVIGDDVWIGAGATVIGHVTVGTGAIVGTGSLVLADVPPYAVVAGVPARPIRMRFEEPVVDRLVRIAWWDWPEAIVQGSYRWFTRPVIEFIDHFDPGSVAVGSASPTGSASRSE